MRWTHEILETVDHRPWPLPPGRWVMAQQWHDLLFAHWPARSADLQALLPEGLELDTWENEAWVGIVPFRMSGVRPRWVPSFPWLSNFPELNVRTYVKNRRGEPKPGVYFFSLEAANPVAVAIARSLFKLPYFNARMNLKENEGESFHYTSHRIHRGAPQADFQGRYGPTGPVNFSVPGTLEAWLTERYALYTAHQGRILRGEIHHLPWPLQPAAAEFDLNTMAQASGIALHDGPPLLHFARQLKVVVWPLTEG